MVIHHISKVIGWKSIIFYDHLVIDHIIIKLNFPVYQIPKLCLAFRYFHPYNKGLTIRLLLSNLVLTEVLSTKPIVFGLRILLATNLLSHLC